MTETYKDYSINIEQDTCDQSPREWDNLGVMYYRHPDYTLGDVEVPRSYYNDNLQDTYYIDDAESFAEWRKYEGDYIAIMLPLAIYDHSGVTMWCGSKWSGVDAQWDCSDVGWIVVTKEQIRKEYNVKRISKKLLDKVEERLRGEVKTFDMYLTGDVYWYEVLDPEGNQVDSCGGYYGYDYCISEAKAAIDSDIKHKQEEKVKQLKK